MKQLGQATRPDDLRAIVSRFAATGDPRESDAWLDAWLVLAMERHYELVALPGVCEALARRDWDGIDVIAARWDF